MTCKKLALNIVSMAKWLQVGIEGISRAVSAGSITDMHGPVIMTGPSCLPSLKSAWLITSSHAAAATALNPRPLLSYLLQQVLLHASSFLLQDCSVLTCVQVNTRCQAWRTEFIVHVCQHPINAHHSCRAFALKCN